MPRKASIPEDLYIDVAEAIWFIQWQTEKEIATAAERPLKDTRKVIKLLMDNGDLQSKGSKPNIKYRYQNAD